MICSSGSACAAGSDEPSHVLTAMGIPAETAQTALRFTFEADVTDEALDRAADELVAAVTGRVPVASPGVEPAVEPYDSRSARASPTARSCGWEASGNPDGRPALYPARRARAGASAPGYRRRFDADHWRIIGLDQRGSGRSRPLASEDLELAGDQHHPAAGRGPGGAADPPRDRAVVAARRLVGHGSRHRVRPRPPRPGQRRRAHRGGPHHAAVRRVDHRDRRDAVPARVGGVRARRRAAAPASGSWTRTPVG